MYRALRVTLPQESLSFSLAHRQIEREKQAKREEARCSEVITEQPHYLGSDNHQQVRDYLVVELEKLEFLPT